MPRIPENAVSDALLISQFQCFAAETKTTLRTVLGTMLRIVLILSMNSGPNILRRERTCLQTY